MIIKKARVQQLRNSIWWSFNDQFARNVIIFGVDNSLSFHTDNLKSDFLILGERNTFSINGGFGAKEKKIDIILVKQIQRFTNDDNSYLFVNGKEIYKFKAGNKNVDFLSQFCLRSITNKFDYLDSEEVLLKEMFMIFQVIILLLTNLTFYVNRTFYVINSHKHLMI